MSKKIKLSEVESSHRQCPTIEGRYLLDLVERLGEALELTSAWLDNQPDGRGAIESKIVKEARALLKELEL